MKLVSTPHFEKQLDKLPDTTTKRMTRETIILSMMPLMKYKHI